MADIILRMLDENKNFGDFVVSDEEWAEELQFQEVVAASLGIKESPESSKGFCDICMETKDTNEMLKLENCSDHSFCSDCVAQYVQSKIQDRIFPVTCPALKCRATIEPVAASLGIQESPESSKGFCDICMETKDTNEMLKLENCSDHSFCSDCVAQYVQSKIQDRIFPVTCPALKCRATIEPVAASLGIQESPESSKGFCDICMETKDTNEMFKLGNCSDHSFCSDCVAQYVQSKIQDRTFPVTCPALKCRATIEPVSCKSIIPEDVFEKWEGGLCESILSDCKKIYCPYKDCSELLIYDQDEDIIECICPVCQRLLCAACGVPWHTGLDCEEFKKDEKNREDDLKVEELANNSKWMKCPHCKHIVQKADGCIHMTCRCGSEFCYVCGEIWSESHWKCQISE